MNICIYGASSAELKKRGIGTADRKTWPWPCFRWWKRGADGCGSPWR